MTIVRHRVGIRASCSDVFRALTLPDQLIGWWPTSASDAFAPGQSVDLGFGNAITLTFNVMTIQDNVSLHLACPDGPGPWNGSELQFELAESDGQTFVTLVHRNAQATDDDFLYFNTKWPVYLLSLRDFIETGRGRPSPNDIPIFVGDSVKSNTS